MVSGYEYLLGDQESVKELAQNAVDSSANANGITASVSEVGVWYTGPPGPG